MQLKLIIARAAGIGERTAEILNAVRLKILFPVIIQPIPKLMMRLKRSFKLLQFTIGDVNNDGQINAADANLAMRMAPNLMEALPAADANEDGNITAADANIIMRWALNLG